MNLPYSIDDAVAPDPLGSAPGLQATASDYAWVRQRSVALCAPLAVEDMGVQPRAEVSPPKWHLAHTTWFFEAMVLPRALPGYQPFDDRFGYLFNSYYQALGDRVARDRRGVMSRPTVDVVHAYRAHVDAAMQKALSRPLAPSLAQVVVLGLHHEQQHQELLLTDIKSLLGEQPLQPAYAPAVPGGGDEHAAVVAAGGTPAWASWPGGIVSVGHGGDGFAFDNEGPRHDVLVHGAALRHQLVSNAEYLEFMNDGGYRQVALWHAEGWDWLQREQIDRPAYWQRDERAPLGWRHYTLAGMADVGAHAPVSHVSWYEAHAFCQWAGWRLPTEFEWEALQPTLHWGQRWEWTGSAYLPYPRYRAAEGALGEYNGKFMANQMVLRGASFATPARHGRATYRNFFHAPERWQYTGIRCARDA